MADAEEVRFTWVDGPDSDGPNRATEEEWTAIDAVCASRGWMSIGRAYSSVLIAWRGEKMIGFHVVQLLPHTEPMWVAEEELGTGLAQQLADQMVAFMLGHKARGWMVIADSPHAEQMCRERGMVKLKSPVYVTSSETMKVH